MVVSQEDLELIRGSVRQIQLLLTDCDGVLTDGSVYYSERGEAMKRFSIRDGMGVEWLRTLAGVEVGIISGEDSAALRMRAQKLRITELYLGIKDKISVLDTILEHHHLKAEQVAYIGDDTNDVDIMARVGLSACPADATPFAKQVANYLCEHRGGGGAFREFAEFIIAARAL
jgi:3-deoxy-D-manno-octulosonate 8-phosphate phosphatase (KDO 8-P phosphatase)